MTRRFTVSRHDEIVLEMTDQPGPLLSTALAPHGFVPPLHPFLSANARNAFAEDELLRLLEASASTDDYVRRLTDAGFDVAETRPPGTVALT